MFDFTLRLLFVLVISFVNMFDFTLTDNNNQIRASSLKLTIALDDMKEKSSNHQ